jgi:nucleoside-diphosphate-sugar epimerase
MRKIGITGATGFLGSCLLNFLHRKGKYQLRAMTRSLRADPKHGLEGIAWQQGDLLSRADCIDFVSQLDVIVHFAHTNTAITSDRDLLGDAMANLFPTLNLLEAVMQSGKKVHLIAL